MAEQSKEATNHILDAFNALSAEIESQDEESRRGFNAMNDQDRCKVYEEEESTEEPRYSADRTYSFHPRRMIEKANRMKPHMFR